MAYGSEKIPPIVKELQQEYISGGYTALRELYRESIERHPELRGWGAESIVFISPDNPDQVIGFVYDKDYYENKKPSPFMVSTTYHTHKIWSILFPHNFPKISFVSDQAEIRTIRQNIEGEELDEFLDKQDEATLNNEPQREIEYPFSAVRSVSNEYNFPELAIDDFMTNNFMVGHDGGEYYVDLVSRSRERIQNWDLDTLRDYMRNETDIPGPLQRQVLKSAEALKYVQIAQLLVLDAELHGEYDLSEETVGTMMGKIGLDTNDDNVRKGQNRLKRILEAYEKRKARQS